jgi:predicted phage terminase large subunit-like protein
MLAKGVKPEAYKITRMVGETPIIEAGCVHLPKTAAWKQVYLDELSRFPKVKFDDQIDSTSQALHFIRTERRMRPRIRQL